MTQAQASDRHMTWDLGKLLELQTFTQSNKQLGSWPLGPAPGAQSGRPRSNLKTKREALGITTYAKLSQPHRLGSLWAGWLLWWLPVRQLLPLSPQTQPWHEPGKNQTNLEKAAMCDTGPNLRSTHDMGLGQAYGTSNPQTSLSNKVTHFASCHWELGRWDGLLGHTLGGLSAQHPHLSWRVATWRHQKKATTKHIPTVFSVTQSWKSLGRLTSLMTSCAAAASTFSSEATLAWTREKMKQTWRKQLCGYVWYRSKPAIDTWHGTWASLWNFKSTNLTI